MAPTRFPARVDRDAMNPPLSTGKGTTHVTHALAFDEPGGHPAAVTGAGVKTSQVRAAQRFRAPVESRGGWFEGLPDDAFAPATNVRTALTVIPH
ncbi:hypothetical protein [Streptosporangium sandarakinum]